MRVLLFERVTADTGPADTTSEAIKGANELGVDVEIGGIEVPSFVRMR